MKTMSKRWGRSNKYRNCEFARAQGVYQLFKQWCVRTNVEKVLGRLEMESGGRGIKVTFSKINPCIKILITSYEFSIFFVDRKNEVSDWIGDFDCLPVRVGKNQYACKFCSSENLELYPSFEELYVHHSFIPAMEWFRERLENSSKIFICGDDGWTSVRVSPPNETSNCGKFLPEIGVESFLRS